MPKLVNNTRRDITVTWQGKRVIVPPGIVIDGPVQLTAYGLTVAQNPAILASQPSTVTVGSYTNTFSAPNATIVNQAKQFIKDYKKDNIPSVAICILSKDALGLLTECIESIEKEVNYKNTLIYVFDTGTTQKEVLDFYKEKESKCKFPFKVINVGNFHFSSNYNNGLRQVSTDFYVIQNNDTVALSDYVSRLMKLAIIDKVGVCGPRMLYKDGRIQHDGQIIFNHQAKGFAHPGHVNLGQMPSAVTTGRQFADGITGAGIFVKASYYWQLGGFSEAYKDIYQDVEFNIKSYMAGKVTVCDRDATIYHYDNTSRKQTWQLEPQKMRFMQEDERFMFSMYGSTLKYTERLKKRFSVVTLVNNQEQYLNLLSDLEQQDANFNFEIIALPNFSNEYQGVAEALNIALDIAESDYAILCHQDIRVPRDWLFRINEHIKSLIAGNVKFGVLGMAGASFVTEQNEYGVIYLTDDMRKSQELYGPIKEVQCLDELCMIVKTSNTIRFDEVNFNHYHLYGADFCLQYLKHGFKNFAINAVCDHLSDGITNLLKPDHLKRFLKDTEVLFKKWRGSFPLFRTMTAKFFSKRNSYQLYIVEALRVRGVTVQEYFNLKD